jgi:hypothetical protein
MKMAETPSSGQSGGVSNTGTQSAGGNIVGGNMTVTTSTSTISKTETAFQPIADAIKTSPDAMRPAAEATLASLKKEVEKTEKGEKPDDGVISGLLKSLAALVPAAVSAIGNAFGGPILGGLAGPATQAVLNELGVDQK